MNKLILILVGIFALVAVLEIVSLLLKRSRGGATPDLSVYEKKPYLFDTTSEFNFYKQLLTWFGGTHHIFPQINYSHLVRAKKMGWKEEQKYRSRIDRKSADFVLCDKERVVPRLVIELDGGSHNLQNRRARDEFIDDISHITNLPVLHIKTSELDNPDQIRAKIESALK